MNLEPIKDFICGGEKKTETYFSRTILAPDASRRFTVAFTGLRHFSTSPSAQSSPFPPFYSCRSLKQSLESILRTQLHLLESGS